MQIAKAELKLSKLKEQRKLGLRILLELQQACATG